MSGSAAGKFQDHYVILGIDSQADQEAIDRAYETFAAKYGQDNIDDADPQKLAMVQLAYEVLSDPGLRKEFDKLKGVDKAGPPKFSGRSFFESRGREAGLRMALLSILYDRRRAFPYRPALSNRHAEGMLDATNEELIFALWYLKQRGLVIADDKSNLMISIEGMEYLESNWPTAELVMPLIKPTALADPEERIVQPESKPAAAPAPPSGRQGARIVDLLRSHLSPGSTS